jgi:hypothetical protein
MKDTFLLILLMLEYKNLEDVYLILCYLVKEYIAEYLCEVEARMAYQEYLYVQMNECMLKSTFYRHFNADCKEYYGVSLLISKLQQLNIVIK